MYPELRTAALLVKESLLQTILGSALDRHKVKNQKHFVWCGEHVNSKTEQS